MAMAQRLIMRDAHLPGIGVCSSPSGYGKTWASIFAQNKTGAVRVEVGDSWTRRTLLRNILKELGETPRERTPVAELAEKVIVGARQQPLRPLIVDEADKLVDRGMIELVREIHEHSGAPVILIGEEKLPAKLLTVERVHNRVLDWMQAQPCDLDDVRHAWPGVRAEAHDVRRSARSNPRRVDGPGSSHRRQHLARRGARAQQGRQLAQRRRVEGRLVHGRAARAARRAALRARRQSGGVNMGKRAPNDPIVLRGTLPIGEAAIWELIKEIDAKGVPWTAATIDAETNRPENSVSGYVSRLKKAGILRVVHIERIGPHRRVTSFFRLVRKPSMAPRLSNKGKVVAPRVVDLLWPAIRTLKQFTHRDLQFATQVGKKPLPISSVSHYVSQLARAGYLVRLQGRDALRQVTFRLRPDMNTGPKAPHMLKVLAIWDPNLRKVVGKGVAKEAA